MTDSIDMIFLSNKCIVLNFSGGPIFICCVFGLAEIAGTDFLIVYYSGLLELSYWYTLNAVSSPSKEEETPNLKALVV